MENGPRSRGLPGHRGAAQRRPLRLPPLLRGKLGTVEEQGSDTVYPRSVDITRRIKTLSKVVAHAAVALVLGSSVIASAQQAPGNAAPAAQLDAARARLDGFRSHRERREYDRPERFVQIVEFSGVLQHWINLDAQGSVVSELIWDKGRSASRKPADTTWLCNPPIPDEATEPPAVVRDGGTLLVNGRSAHRLVEEFTNPLAGSHVVHEVDVDAATGVPIRLISTETEGSYVTRYVGTYYDLGASIALVFPRCP